MTSIAQTTLPLFLVALFALSACDKKPAPPKAPPPAQVGVVTLKPQAVALTTELPGRTDAYLTADVRPQVNGVITKRIFTEGADVTMGQQLYQIDPATYKATYDSAVATLQYNRAALATARAKTARYKPLAAAQAVSRQDYDDAAASSGEAVANIATAMASIEQANINLAYTKVMAPISGRIGRSTVTPGALVPRHSDFDRFGGADKIDLLNTAETSFSYTSNVLTVLNGSATVAELNFAGASNGFSLVSDMHGGTLITFG